LSAGVLGLAAVSLGAWTVWAGPEQKEAGTAKCCFANPRYSGKCVVEPGKDETCQSILEYLNNANSVGKGYCGGTDIRGGWAKVDCDKEEP
jgi:hypothetical protein